MVIHICRSQRELLINIQICYMMCFVREKNEKGSLLVERPSI
jgi:hypothetical protein